MIFHPQRCHYTFKKSRCYWLLKYIPFLHGYIGSKGPEIVPAWLKVGFANIPHWGLAKSPKPLAGDHRLHIFRYNLQWKRLKDYHQVTNATALWFLIHPLSVYAKENIPCWSTNLLSHRKGACRGPFEKYVTVKIPIFDPPSPLVTVCHRLPWPPSPLVTTQIVTNFLTRN